MLARVDDSDGCSVKDSWARLDLSVEDFACLVVGEWVWLDPATALGTVGAVGDPWQQITTTQDFTDWVAAWASEPEALAVLRPSLLGEPGVHVLGARAGSALDAPFTAGAIVNVTDGVAGLGNVFSTRGDDAATWSAAAAAARTAVGPLPIVGWEAGHGVDAAVDAGCERLGPLSVWLK